MTQPTQGSASPPFVNYEAETAVLGSIALSPDVLPDVLQILQSEDFYSPAHRQTFEAMLHLARAGTPIDAVTLYDEFHRGGMLEQVGGADFIARIMDAVPSPANAIHYARAVHEQSTARTGSALADRLKSELGSLNGATAWTKIAEIARDLGKLSEPQTAGATDVTALLANPPLEPINILDTPGLLDVGELHIVAGPPGSGKSLLAVNLAVAVAAGAPFWHLREFASDPLPVLVILAEYTRYRAFQRLCNTVTSSAVRPGFLRLLTREDMNPRIDLADSGASAARLCALVRRHGIRLLLIDSLSEVNSADENDRGAMMRVVHSLRLIAAEGCAVLIVHHDRKAPAGAKHKGDPSIADMRGTTAIPAALASVLACRREEGEGTARSFLAMWVKSNYASPSVRAFHFILDEPRSGVISEIEPCDGRGRKPSASDEEVIQAIRAGGEKNVPIATISAALGVSDRTARQYLNAMVERNRIPAPAKGFHGVQLWNLF